MASRSGFLRVVPGFWSSERRQPILRLAVRGSRGRQLPGADSPWLRRAIVHPVVVAVAARHRDHLRSAANKGQRQPGPRQRRGIGDAERRLAFVERPVERFARRHRARRFADLHVHSDSRPPFRDVHVGHRAAAQRQREHRRPPFVLEHRVQESGTSAETIDQRFGKRRSVKRGHCAC